ncbi:hypothetical protein AUK22_06965 [bacterium CG2_30_54_10]|nr:MAG: hypothetical protein AUK22_06965 [bacterium CG2_30_54_10]
MIHSSNQCSGNRENMSIPTDSSEGFLFGRELFEIDLYRQKTVATRINVTETGSAGRKSGIDQQPKA